MQCSSADCSLPYVTFSSRVTSHEQLTVAEFSGEQTRPNVNENGLKKVLSIWFDLVLKVKYSTILIFKVIFLCQKSAESSRFFFSLNNSKKGDQLFLMTYFHSFDFQCTLFSKMVPNFFLP